MDAAPCCFIQDSPTVRDLNGFGDLLLRLGLVLDGDGQVALVVDADSAIFFLNAWSSKFHRVGLLTLLDIGRLTKWHSEIVKMARNLNSVKR